MKDSNIRVDSETVNKWQNLTQEEYAAMRKERTSSMGGQFNEEERKQYMYELYR
jgi:transposase-like protein